MNRHSEIITTGPVSIETYIDGDGNGPDIVVLPSCGRDGGEDFDPFSAALADAGYHVLRPQPRGTARSAGPMTGVTIDDLGADVTAVTGIDSGRYWGAGTAPILEILAEYDPFHPKDQWEDLRTQLGPRVTTAVISEASHALFPEQPGAVADAVLKYLASLT